MNNQFLCLLGPTGVGKTAISLELAKDYPIEIICLDSVTLYKKLDIGSNKPTLEEQSQCKHHLLDILSLDEPIDLAQYYRLFVECVKDINSRGKIALAVGGSMMYAYGICRGIYQVPQLSSSTLGQLEKLQAQNGLDFMYRLLQQADPETARKLSEQDSQRIQRAYGVFLQSGKTLSAWQKEKPLQEVDCRAGVFLNMPRKYLKPIIQERTQQMLEQGLVEEVQELVKTYSPPYSKSLQSIGYKEVIESLNQAEQQDLASKILASTMRYAKHQQTWGRKLVREIPEITLLQADAREDLHKQAAEFFRKKLCLDS